MKQDSEDAAWYVESESVEIGLKRLHYVICCEADRNHYKPGRKGQKPGVRGTGSQK